MPIWKQAKRFNRCPLQEAQAPLDGIKMVIIPLNVQFVMAVGGAMFAQEEDGKHMLMAMLKTAQDVEERGNVRVAMGEDFYNRYCLSCSWRRSSPIRPCPRKPLDGHIWFCGR